MSKIESITYTRRKPEEQYGHSEISVTITPDEGANLEQEAIALREKVHKILKHKEGSKVDFSEVEEVTEEGDFKMKDGTTKKVDETTEVEHKEEEEPKKKAKKKATKKKKKVVKEKKPNIPYNRELLAHKDELAKILNTHIPGWKKSEEGRNKARGLSEKLVGADLFDSEGNLLDSFVETVKKGMS